MRLVTLLEVNIDKRIAAADRVIRREGLVGYPAIEMMLAARTPATNPELLVDEELARKVLGA